MAELIGRALVERIKWDGILKRETISGTSKH